MKQTLEFGSHTLTISEEDGMVKVESTLDGEVTNEFEINTNEEGQGEVEGQPEAQEGQPEVQDEEAQEEIQDIEEIQFESYSEFTKRTNKVE